MNELREIIEIEYEKLDQVIKGLPASEKLIDNISETYNQFKNEIDLFTKNKLS